MGTADARLERKLGGLQRSTVKMSSGRKSSAATGLGLSSHDANSAYTGHSTRGSSKSTSPTNGVRLRGAPPAASEARKRGRKWSEAALTREQGGCGTDRVKLVGGCLAPVQLVA